MITLIICAIICAACTIHLITPLQKKHPRLAYALMVLLPILSLGIYLLGGAPDMPSHGALLNALPAP